MKKSTINLPDTNVILRYLLHDDEPLYIRAREFFDRVREGSVRAIILESVIAECVYVLMKIYGAPRQKVAESLTDILRYKGIVNDDLEHLVSALALFSKRKIDIVDCILYAKATRPNTTLFSFDHALNTINDSRSWSP